MRKTAVRMSGIHGGQGQGISRRRLGTCITLALGNESDVRSAAHGHSQSGPLYPHSKVELSVEIPIIHCSKVHPAADERCRAKASALASGVEIKVGLLSSCLHNNTPDTTSSAAVVDVHRTGTLFQLIKGTWLGSSTAKWQVKKKSGAPNQRT